jgi:CubicO group peptidase (beta-lactamase class C family)
MNKLIRYLVVLFFCAAYSQAWSLDSQQLDTALTELADKNDFNGVVLVAKDGQVIFEKAYGMANFAKKTPNTPNTQFMIGAITQQFTGAAIIKLWEKKKLNLSGTLVNYLPNFKAHWTKDVTINFLLGHRSGVPDVGGEYNIGIKKKRLQPSVALFMRSIQPYPLKRAPGSEYEFSNSGYNILGAVIEKVSGTGLVKFYTTNFFEPVGMTETFFPVGKTYGEVQQDQPNVAMIYDSPTKKGLHEPLENPNFPIPLASGGIFSTVRDLLKWTEALYDGKVLTAPGLKSFLQPRAEIKDGQQFAAGVIINDGGKYALRYMHSGNYKSYQSLLIYFPEQKITVAMLANFSMLNPPMLRDKLLELIDANLVSLKP